MQDIILHHYSSSPFAEKVRVALGIKQLAWHSVDIPVVMPKPDLMPLTGGYRRTPVMQIGADIYCDTQCILRELQRRFPEPSFYRGTDAGTATGFAFWSERTIFSAAVSVALVGRPNALPPEFLEDRSKFSGRELDIERLKAGTPLMLDQLRAQLSWFETTLSDERAYLCGEHPTLVDCAAYHPCWFLRNNLGANAAPLAEFPRIQVWMDRMKAIGHGKPSAMEAKDALQVAKKATPQVSRRQDADDPMRRKSGDKVQIMPDDTGRDPVVGELLASSRDDIVILRQDEKLGEIAVHFPRAGFVVQPAK